MIEQASTEGERRGLAVWGQDEAGPFSTMPFPGQRWQPEGQPARQPHESLRNGTAQRLTLFHPASGQVRVKGVTRSTNEVLHGWLKEELAAIAAALPAPTAGRSPAQQRAVWEVWQEGLSVRPSLPTQLPPLKLLLVLDHLAGQKTPELVGWLFDHGILPRSAPLSGSWLNRTELVQRILSPSPRRVAFGDKRRALDGQAPQTTHDIMDWLEAAGRGWNAAPTPFVWGGKRQARRQRAWERRHRTGGSGACTRHAVRRGHRPAAISQNGDICVN